MAKDKVYWKGFDHLANTEVSKRLSENEFAEDIPMDQFLGDDNLMGNSSTSRRDFLKYVGFSTAAATLAACEQPIVESIPYVVKPDSLTPGMPAYYATSYVDGQDFASVLVKTREGRPIKIEPGDKARFNWGTNGRAQASVLSLYDSARLKQPLKAGVESDWTTISLDLKEAIDQSVTEGKQFVLMTGSVFSPSMKLVIENLRQSYANLVHVEVDAISNSKVLDVWEDLTGVRSIPGIDMKAADIVVSFNEDFLSSSIPQQLSSDYAFRRKPGKGMLRHIHLESNLSLTGSNADKRIKLKPSQVEFSLAFLLNFVSGTKYHVGKIDKILTDQLERVAKELIAAKGKSLILVGGNSTSNAYLCAALNAALKNFGSTIRPDRPIYTQSGSDLAFDNAMADMNQGQVGVLVIAGPNPVYNRIGFDLALNNVEYSLSLTDRLDETATLTDAAAPVPHYLESWADFAPTNIDFSVSQPVIRPLFNSKPVIEVLSELVGIKKSSKDLVKESVISQGLNWSQTLHDGGASIKIDSETLSISEIINRAITSVKVANSTLNTIDNSVMEISLYQKTVGAGYQSNNPWLHELPDPISRCSWDNYLTISAADALAMEFINETLSNGALDGSLADIQAGEYSLKNVPVLIQPGQAAGTVGLALGYGRKKVGKVADGLGVNANELNLSKGFGSVVISKTDGMHQFASTQLGNTMMGRKIVNEVSLNDFINDPKGSTWNEKPTYHTLDGTIGTDEANLWKNHDHETMHMWNMSIDLNSCHGCGACVIACHIENNVPVVGKAEIRNFRDMHWLRIDRYYSSDMTAEIADMEDIGVVAKYAGMEKPGVSPEVVFQPVMCQHCNHAPCETVCPVGATVHSREGLNHMAYNRCIGTRYCANNCPYKVRRFNWFNYQKNERFTSVNPSQDDLGRMVLNPDVTVRARGVMEKCSMCIQNIQFGKLEAKKAGRPLKDGEINCACESACDSGAITFGDVNTRNSAVQIAKNDSRSYHLLEEVGTQPSVFYQTKVRNRI
ncbi:MAG: Menaquinone reductase, iron-sulfur cluster-binding subunit [Owenweeksia sp. TMED14]|nr:MAG: Menaquinone reductase, iron-sulfur cluster-binding subunit [Owenweeksia sp. TMED14]